MPIDTSPCRSFSRPRHCSVSLLQESLLTTGSGRSLSDSCAFVNKIYGGL